MKHLWIQLVLQIAFTNISSNQSLKKVLHPEMISPVFEKLEMAKNAIFKLWNVFPIGYPPIMFVSSLSVQMAKDFPFQMANISHIYK